MEKNLPEAPARNSNPESDSNESKNGSSTKDRLASIASTFQDFDLDMRRGTRVSFYCIGKHVTIKIKIVNTLHNILTCNT